MRIARYNGGRTALVVGARADTILDVWSNLIALPEAARRRIERNLPSEGRGSWEPMIGNWDDIRPAFEQLIGIWEADASSLELREVMPGLLEAPLPSMERRIFSLGANTVAHIKAAAARVSSADVTPESIFEPKNAGASPVGFNVLPDSVVGPDASIRPPTFTKKLDYEGECAVVVGRRKPGANWREAIWGVVVWSDYGIRDAHVGLLATTPSFGYSLNLWKNFDSANACGPWMVVDEDIDLHNLRCRTYVNGEKRQDWNTSEMIYSFEETLANIDGFMPVKPGDMITSGTGSGCALESPVDSALWLQPGDRVEIDVDGLGSLVNTVVDWRSHAEAEVRDSVGSDA